MGMSGDLSTMSFIGESSRSPASERWKCDNCDCESPRRAVSFCSDCGGYQCEECSERLHKERMFRNHGKMNIDDYCKLRGCIGTEPVTLDQLDNDNCNKFCFYSPSDDRIHLSARLASLVEDPAAQPSLVSFIGPSGAGKSTLIRLLLSLDNVVDEASIPLSGAPNDPCSTSSDLNIYGGGKVLTYPALYVDSEGLGGTKKPHAFVRMMKDAKINADVDRSAHVRTSFPRILYIFSDVLCFVFSGDRRQQEQILGPLLDWGKKAAIGAANQHLPQLFLIINKVGSEGNQVEFEDFGQAFEKWCQDDVSYEVLRKYYSNPRVVLIPNMDINVSNVFIRVQQLLEEIRRSTVRVRAERKKLNQLHTRYRLQMYIRLAADVFRRSPYADFDICKAMFAKSPNPVGLNGYICDFRRVVEQAQGSDISSCEKYCTSLNLLRRRIQHSIHIWRNRHPHVPFSATSKLPGEFQSALEDAQDKIEKEIPCAELLNKSSCETLSGSHGKFHSFTDGIGNCKTALKIDGNFRTHPVVERAVSRCKLVDLAEMVLRSESCDAKENRKTFRENRREDHEKYPWLYKVSSFQSCLVCMLALPTEMLSCDHIICYMCAEDEADDNPLAQECLSNPSMSKPSISMYCPICFKEVKWYPKKLPSLAGYRILSLDGGGVRGIVELLTLQKIMSYLSGMHVEDLFDMIIGTSTGGIIALALTAHRDAEHPKRLPDVIKLFKNLAREVFSSEQLMTLAKYKWIRYIFLLLNVVDSKYKNEKLLEILKEHLGEKNLLRTCVGGPHVIITACDVDDDLAAAWFTSYNQSDDLLQHEAHSNNQLLAGRVRSNHLFTATEVAAATSAAPTFFPLVEAGNRRWADGGLRYNGPALIAMHEARRMWPGRQASVLISLGCGKLKSAQARGMESKLQLFKLIVDIATDAEQKCIHAIDQLNFEPDHTAKNVIGRGLRLNPIITLSEGQKIKLDDVEKMDFLVSETMKYLKTKEGIIHVQQAANLLFAALFYLHIEFDMDAHVPKSWHIRSCSALSESIRDVIMNAPQPRFSIMVKEAGRPTSEFLWNKVTWENDFMDLPFTLSSLPQVGLKTIVVKLHMRLRDSVDLPQDWCLPISGMPYKLDLQQNFPIDR